MMTCNVISPQLFWVRSWRRNLTFSFIMSLVVNTGMWFERFVIIVTSLHRDYLPSSWTLFHPTWVGRGHLPGLAGHLLHPLPALRPLLPVVALNEMKSILKMSGESYKKQQALAPNTPPPTEPWRTRPSTRYTTTRGAQGRGAHGALGGVKVKDVYSPFPIHGIDPIIGLKRTRIGITSFLYGATGTTLALLGMWYFMISDWPMDIGASRA
jgi:molybdopterin-containing oxidoreductase family membrane subunit